MATLEGQTIAGSYKDLLQVSNSNSGVDATARAVSDGEGTATLLYLSTTEVYSPGTGGTSNTAFGKNAGDALTTNGDYNVFIGEEAGSAMASGTNNIAIGYGAFDAADAGEDDCIAIGLNALGNLNHASSVRNIAIGSGAGDGMGTLAGSIDNTFIGHDAGGGTWATAVSTYNVGIGNYVMDAAMNGALYNTGVGYASLSALTEGDQNTVVGYQAGDSIDTGSWNILMGVNTGGAITTGGENTALGSGALAALTEGARNIAIGSGSLDAAAVSESDNIAIGQNALGSVDEGTAGGDADLNIAIGYQALLGGDFAGNDRQLQGNIAIGGYALDDTAANAQTGTIAIGHQALSALTSGASNTAVGYQALSSVTTGQWNTAVGYQAADVLPAGADSNTAIGQGALGAGNNATCDKNTCVGDGAGGNITTGYKNTIIGAASQPGGVDAINQTLVGYGVTTLDVDNSVVLGDSNVTAVYMAQDSGAIVHCEDVRIADGGAIGSATSPETIVIASTGTVGLGNSNASGTNDTAFNVQGYGTSRPSIRLQENHASFAAASIYAAYQCNVVRAANTAYNFYSAVSGDGADQEFAVGGTGIVVSDGGFNPDYAEYFESTDGSAIPIGTTVVLEEQKVRAATESEQPIGVIRPANSSTVVGGNAWNKWWLKHMRDDYGAYLWEEYTQTEWADADGELHTYQTDLIPDGVTVPDDAKVTSEDTKGAKLKRRKLNPDYDATIAYVTREDRDEWNVVALMGQVPIKKGQPTASSWIKMGDTNMQGVASDTIEMWFVK
jgi:hypothetical protein